MKAIICAAGRGSRLAGLTKEYPKALLPVGGKCVVGHILESLFACGIRDVIIVLGYKEETVKRFLGEYSFGCNLSYVRNEHFEITDNLYSMWLTREYITDGMLFLNGDTIFHADILKKFLTSGKNDAVVVDAVNKQSNPVSVHIKNGRVAEIGHTIEGQTHGDVFGIYKLSQSSSERYFSVAGEIFVGGPQRGGFFIPLQKMAAETKIEPFFSNDPRWININHEEDYQMACRMLGASPLGGNYS